jgi:thymidylate synthase
MVYNVNANSIREARYKEVSLITSKGKYGKDQRHEKVQYVKNLLTEIDADNCELSDDKLTARQQKAFKDDLINWIKTDHVYTYGTEAREENALEKTIELLRENPETRRAVIPLFKPRHVGQEDVPCMATICLDIEDDALNETIFARSNEKVIAAQSDLYGLAELLKWIADKDSFDIGSVLLHVVNAHVRINSEGDLIKKILQERY